MAIFLATTWTAIAAGTAAVGTIAGMSAADKAGKRQAAAGDAAGVAAQRQADLADKQDARADEQWQRYKSTYAPAEDKMVEDAQTMGSVANQGKAASDAAATSAATFSNARSRLSKNPGLNPSSQQYQQLQSGIGLAEAANSAAMQTGARESVKDRATAALSNAVSLGKNLPANASGMSQSAGNMNQSVGLMQNQISNAAGIAGQNEVNGIGAFTKGIGGLINSAPVQKWVNGSGATAIPEVGPMPLASNQP